MFNLNRKFIHWFIGFSEGNGSFIVPSSPPEFEITQNLRDIDKFGNGG